MQLIAILSLAVLATSSGAAQVSLVPGFYSPYTYQQSISHSLPLPYTLAAPSAPLAYTVAAPLPAHIAAPVPFSPVKTQYHSQDELGRYSFGYSGGPSSRAESKDAFGIVRGQYNYIDSEGKVQTTNYVADALGFRVSATNIPQAPVAEDAPVLVAPEPVKETAEVAAARADFEKLFDEAAAAAEAAPDSRKKRSAAANTPAAVSRIYSPPGFSYAYSTLPHHTVSYSALPAPVTYSTLPAVHTFPTAHYVYNAPTTYTVPA